MKLDLDQNGDLRFASGAFISSLTLAAGSVESVLLRSWPARSTEGNGSLWTRPDGSFEGTQAGSAPLGEPFDFTAPSTPGTYWLSAHVAFGIFRVTSHDVKLVVLPA